MSNDYKYLIQCRTEEEAENMGLDLYIQKYRLYAFVHSYLSGIQKGLQTAHLVAEMGNKLKKKREKEIFHVWSNYDKTIIILDGGNQNSLNDILLLLVNRGFPCASFVEDYESLNECVTVVGAILPESIYGEEPKNEEDLKLHNLLKGLHLAV